MNFFLGLPIAALLALLFLGPKAWRTAWGRWALLGSVTGAVATAVVQLYAIFHSTSSTAGIGILFVPFEMVLGAAIGAILGLAAFQAAGVLRPPKRGIRGKAIGLASMALLVLFLVYSVQQVVRIRSFYSYQRARDPSTLTTGAAEALRTNDYFLLSAIMANANTPASVLLDVARQPDPGLHRKRHQWIDMFDHDQLAVMRKVLRNPHSPVEVFSILSASPDDYVLADVCADKRTPEPILRGRCASRNQYLVQWSLAGNASTPLPILRELARHDDPLVRQGVAGNPSADTAILTMLSRDPVDSVAQEANRHLTHRVN